MIHRNKLKRVLCLSAGLMILLVLNSDVQAQFLASDEGPWLVFDVAKSIYATTSQGGCFIVEVKADGKRQIVHRVVWGAESGLWLPQAVNFAPYAGKRIKIRLQTIAPCFLSNQCWLFWGQPRVVLGPLDGKMPPRLIADLTENFRLKKDCRRYVFDAEHVGPLKTDQYDFTGGYHDFGSVGPVAMPALFCNPYAIGHHDWAGYEFEVTLPVRTVSNLEKKSAVRQLTEKILVQDVGKTIPILWWQEEVYRGISGGSASVNFDTMTLRAHMPKSESNFGYAFAGFETKNCTSFKIRCRYDHYVPAPAYGEMGDNRFVGIILDYHTAAGYSRRVWLHDPKFKPDHPERRSERRAPTWQMYFPRLNRVTEVNWRQIYAELPENSIFTLDLKRYAPSDWDGRLWFGVGIQDAGSQKTLNVKIIDRVSFNND